MIYILREHIILTVNRKFFLSSPGFSEWNGSVSGPGCFQNRVVNSGNIVPPPLGGGNWKRGEEREKKETKI